MSWILPAPMFVIAFAAALLFVPSLARRSVSMPRLTLEAFLAGLAAVAIIQACWAVYWLIEQRW